MCSYNLFVLAILTRVLFSDNTNTPAEVSCTTTFLWCETKSPPQGSNAAGTANLQFYFCFSGNSCSPLKNVISLLDSQMLYFYVFLQE
jgi:hypothetical protein